MKKRLMLMLGLCVVFSSFSYAQSCTRRTPSKEQLQRELEIKKAEQNLPWVELVKNETRGRPSYASTYGFKTVAFKQTPVSKKDAQLFTKRKSTIQMKINGNGILKGYDLVVPNPTDLTSVCGWEIDNLAMFFRQGLTYGEVHGDYMATAKKFQDGVVEIRFQPKASSHTFIILVNCSRTKIYLFLDAYKNRIKDSF